MTFLFKKPLQTVIILFCRLLWGERGIGGGEEASQCKTSLKLKGRQHSKVGSFQYTQV